MPPRVKICGIKTAEIMDAAVDAGAEYVGLVFFAKSPRHVTIAHAHALASRARTRGGASVVALMVDPRDDEVAAVASGLKPDYLQLHGHETPERVREIRRLIALPIIKAIPVSTAEDAAKGLDYRGSVDLILFDAKPPPNAALPGGNGVVFDWTVLRAIRAEFPFMVSGGLTADNVAAAIAACDPLAVDVSSGVEAAPGVKDADLIRQFIAAAKAG